MRKTGRENRTDRRRAAPTPPSGPVAGEAHAVSLTAVAADALARGGLAGGSPRVSPEIPGEAGRIRCGDPDQSVLENEYAGDDLPGGSTPTPDQNVVDEIGRAYGVQEEDSGALRSSAEILDRRDRKRSELVPPPRRRD